MASSRPDMMPVDQALAVALVAIDHCRQRWNDDESRSMLRARRTLERLKDQVESNGGNGLQRRRPYFPRK